MNKEQKEARWIYKDSEHEIWERQWNEVNWLPFFVTSVLDAIFPTLLVDGFSDKWYAAAELNVADVALFIGNMKLVLIYALGNVMFVISYTVN